MPADRPKKILFVTQNLDVGGAERQLVSLATGLQEKNYQVAVAVFYSGGVYQQELQRAGVTILDLSKQGRWDVLFFIARLFKMIKSWAPDILHPYQTVPNILSVICKLFRPGMKIVWGVRASNMDPERYDYLVGLSYWLERGLSRFADLIIVNSHAGMEFMAGKGFPRGKMQVIANGIDVDCYQPDQDAGNAIRREWAIDENKLLIGLIARLDPMKDHRTFLRAAELFKLQSRDVCFVCVGNGTEDYKQQLIAFSKELGLQHEILWTGARNDLSAIYNALDIVTSASAFGEGFSNVIGEAMACGVPCVVTDVGDSARIVGNSGIVITAGNSGQMAEAWLRLSQGEANLDPGEIRARIVREFSLHSLIENTARVL